MTNRAPIVFAVATLLASTAALAQDNDPRSQARDLGKKGQDAFDSKNYKESEDDFRHADALFHAPTLFLGRARAQAAEGKLIEAWESYHRILVEAVTTSAPFARALAEAKTEIAAVEARRGRANIAVSGTDQPQVTLDGMLLKSDALGVERFVNPGAHVVKANGPGMKEVTREFTTPEGGAQSIAIALEKDQGPQVASDKTQPPPPPPPPGDTQGKPNRLPSIIAFGVGGAGLVLGAVTGGLALGKHGTLHNECPGNVCPPSASSDLSSYHTMGTLSTVGFIVAGVGAVGGVVLLFVGPKTQAQSTTGTFQLTPYVGAGSLGAVGRF
jgi:hypothetical protein